MNIKYLSLLLVITFVTTHPEVRTGNITFNNTLNQAVSYEYTTKPSGNIPGINAKPNSITVRGRGEIAANTTQAIHSSFKLKGEDAWGDTIDVVLRRNPNESFPFKINQLGTYTIAVDPNNNLSLKK